MIDRLMLSRTEHRLRKGHGYHWDLLLCSFLLILSALLGRHRNAASTSLPTPCAGLPWLCAGPVRSLAHLHSVTSYRLRAPGQPPVVHSVWEQRLTAAATNVVMLLVRFAWHCALPCRY